MPMLIIRNTTSVSGQNSVNRALTNSAFLSVQKTSQEIGTNISVLENMVIITLSHQDLIIYMKKVMCVLELDKQFATCQNDN